MNLRSLIDSIQGIFSKEKDNIFEDDVLMEDETDVMVSVDEEEEEKPKAGKKNPLALLSGIFPKRSQKKPKPKKEPKKSASASSGGKKQAVNGKRLAMLTLAGLLVLGGGFYYTLWQDEQAVIHRNQEKQKKGSTEGISGKLTAGIKLPQSISVNPFVELRNSEAMSMDGNLSITPRPGSVVNSPYTNPDAGTNSHRSTSYAASSLPAIPSYSTPRPSLPSGTASTPMPASAPAAQASSAPAASSSIQGVMVGSNGNSIAIMSDGSVVGEGETYNDKRIAYIGGDGIHFENGTSIQYQP